MSCRVNPDLQETDPPPIMQSTDTPDTTLHAVGTSAFVGLMVAGLWWACGRCHRSLLLEARLCADTDSVYRFLSDPKNLKTIHPTTKDVRVQHNESRPENTLDFVWVEKTGLHFSTKSLMSMRRNNETRTVCISNKLTVFKLRLEWVLEEDTKASRADQSQIGASEEGTRHVTTVFHNTVTMSGPRLLVLIFWTPVSNLERQLMRNVQKLFADS